MTTTTYSVFEGKQQALMRKKLILQRVFYAVIGVFTMVPIILFAVGQIRTMRREDTDFVVCLLILVHAGCVIYSILSTALFCRVTDALLTSLTIILLFAYAGTHFYVRVLFDYHRDRMSRDFTVITLRLGFVLIMLILMLPWTSLMTHTLRRDQNKEITCPRAATFSLFLKLNFMLLISLLTLNIRSQADFGRYQLVCLSIGVPLGLLWLTVGRLLTTRSTRHWAAWISFYILSFVQILHLAYVSYWALHEFGLLSKVNEASLFPLLIITAICGGASILIHLLTMMMSFTLCCT